MFTDEKKKALRVAITAHNGKVKEAIQDLKEIRAFCDSKTTMQDLNVLDDCSNVLSLLAKLQQYNEEFIDDLKN